MIQARPLALTPEYEGATVCPWCGAFVLPAYPHDCVMTRYYHGLPGYAHELPDYVPFSQRPRPCWVCGKPADCTHYTGGRFMGSFCAVHNPA